MLQVHVCMPAQQSEDYSAGVMVSVLEFVHKNIPATLRQITNCLSVALYPGGLKLLVSLDKMLGDLCWTGTFSTCLTNAFNTNTVHLDCRTKHCMLEFKTYST